MPNVQDIILTRTSSIIYSATRTNRRHLKSWLTYQIPHRCFGDVDCKLCELAPVEKMVNIQIDKTHYFLIQIKTNDQVKYKSGSY